MEDPKLIFLGPACQKDGDGREWCEDDVWTQCECGCSSVRYMLESDAQSELAALREELATAKRNEHNSEVAYKAAIEKQGELREELENSECMRENNRIDAKIYKDSLTAAEQRNSVMTECLERLRGCSQLQPTPSLIDLIDSALEK